MRSNSDYLIPVAETFHSIQGEGFWSGTPMHFIRLAGCPVGAAATKNFKDLLKIPTLLPVLDNGVAGSMCQTFDDRFFVCDTDFRWKESVQFQKLLDDTHEHHICLTGGEPLIHQSKKWWPELLDACVQREIMIHFETSGTIALLHNRNRHHWFACAPKKDYIPSFLTHVADEMKLLVDSAFDETKIPDCGDMCKVYLTPINEEHTVDQNNTQRCLDILSRHPDWRLSVQLHKYLNVR